jgi:hypothetical protein
MNWTIEQANLHFSELLQAAQTEPQVVFYQHQLVAAVINAPTFQAFEHWHKQSSQQSLASAFEELRQICREENYELELPPRQDRQ